MSAEEPTAESLIIDSVRIEAFGPWRTTSIPLESKPFVVLHGNNESGKSSLAELVTWLIGGPPEAGVADALKFGDLGSNIGGSLEATNGSKRVRATVDVKVLKQGNPSANGFSYEIDSVSADAKSWSAHLNGIDSAVMRGIYRFSGTDLHSGEVVNGQLRNLTISSLSGGKNPQEVMKDLTSRVKSLTTSQKAGVVSVKTLTAEARGHRGNLADIELNAHRYGEVQNHLVQLDRERGSAREQHADADRQVTAIQRVQDGAETKRRVSELNIDLVGLAECPAAWQGFADDAQGFQALVADLSAANENQRQSRSSLDRHLDELACDEDVLEGLVIAEQDVTALVRAGGIVASALGSAEKLQEDLRDRQVALAKAERATEVHLQALGGVERSKVQQARLTDDSVIELRAATEQWRERLQDVEASREALDSAKEDIRTVEQQRKRADERWEQQGLGSPPVAHAQSVNSAASAARRPSFQDVLLSSVLLGGLLVGLVLQEWLVVGLAIFALLVVGYFFWFSSTQVPGALSEEQSVQQRARDEEVTTLTVKLERATSDSEDAHNVVLSARRKADATAIRIRGLCEDCDVPVAASPVNVDALVNAWSEAKSTVEDEGRAHERQDAAAAAEQRARVDVEEKRTKIDLEITGLGIPDGFIDASDPGPTLKSFRDAARAKRDADAAVDTVARFQAEVDKRTRPIRDEVEVEGWSLERIAQHAGELDQLQIDRREKADAITSLERDLSNKLGESSLVTALDEENLDQDSLSLRLEKAEEQRDKAQGQMDELAEQAGKAQDELARLRNQDEVAAVRAEVDALESQQQDLAVEAAATSIALQVLTRVADKHERANQPAIVTRASELLRTVAPRWQSIVTRSSDDSSTNQIFVRDEEGTEVPVRQLSTGASGLLYLAFRVAMAYHDAERRGVKLPLICDDPLVHLDDERAALVMPILRAAADSGHQVLLFTCHQRTADRAVTAGAELIKLASNS